MQTRDRRRDTRQVVLQGSLADLMSRDTRRQAVGKGVVEAAEQHTATGQGFQRWQPKALTHSPASPILRRVVEVDLGAVEQVNQILHPAVLHLHSQSLGFQRWHQLFENVGTALTLLHQYIDRPFGDCIPR